MIMTLVTLTQVLFLKKVGGNEERMTKTMCHDLCFEEKSSKGFACDVLSR